MAGASKAFLIACCLFVGSPATEDASCPFSSCEDESLSMLHLRAVRRVTKEAGALQHEKVHSGAATVTLARFVSNGVLNARYTERPGADYEVNGKPTYWSPDGNYFLYWCPFTGFEQWQVVWASDLAPARDERMCNWNAHGPTGASAISDAANAGNWVEWVSASQQGLLKRGAGVEVVSTEEEISSSWKPDEKAMEHPECGLQAMLHLLRSQPACSNCWAISTAAVVEASLCLSGHNFTGPNAYISPGYISSCAEAAFMGDNGCQGGNAVEALRWVATHGVPTGGPNTSVTTCVPYFMTALDETSAPPACPTSCTTEGAYPRSLKEDLFKPAGLAESWITTAPESARIALENGPILISFPVDADFQNNYKGGVVESHGDVLFYHVTMAFLAEGNVFYALNSWGETWGEVYHPNPYMSLPGTFRISAAVIRDYIIPGFIGSSNAGLPLPLPTWSMGAITLAGFQNEALNGEYQEAAADLGGATVMDQPLYCQGEDQMERSIPASSLKAAMANRTAPPEPSQEALQQACMYYCKWNGRWCLAERGAVQEIRDTGFCTMWAKGPLVKPYVTLPDMQRDLSMLRGWSVWDAERQEFVPNPDAHAASVSLPIGSI